MCSMNYNRMLILLAALMNTIDGIDNYSLNRTTADSWKRSNSIEILKKLIANRRILTKYNRTLTFPSKFHLII